MASCENKYITLLDLSRQAKVITGETACFDGKIQVGIAFSGYPTGIDTGTTVSLGFVSGGTETSVFSGNTGTTVFDVSNSGSTNYNSLFSGYSGTVWTNVLYSGNTSGLTLPITPLSANTQVVGPVWTLTQTATTSNGEHIIDIQYTGYSITYSFNQIEQLPFTAYTAFSGFCSASQENFSAGTLDYKGPLDYISTKEDATVEGILTTKKLTVTDGASASTIGYVLTQIDSSGRAGWAFNSASASTNTFVTGGTLNGTNLDLSWNTGGSVPSIELSGLTFTGNTSGDCITDIHVSNIHSCSPLNINPLDEGNVYFGANSGVTIDLESGNNNLLLKSQHIFQSPDQILSTYSGYTNITKGHFIVNDWSGITSTIISNSGTSGTSGVFVGDFTKIGNYGSLRWFSKSFVRSSTGSTTGPNFYQNKVRLGGSSATKGLVINPNAGNSLGTLWFEVNGSSTGVMYSEDGYWGFGLDPDGTEMPSAHLQVGGTGTTGTFKFLDGNEQNGYVLTSDANGVGSWQVPTFTGNTSGDCITDLWLTNLHGCSPISVHDEFVSYSGGGILNLREGGVSNNVLLGNNSGSYGSGWLLLTDNSAYLQRNFGYGFEVDGDVTMTSSRGGVIVKDITSTHLETLDSISGNLVGVVINSTNSAILSGISNTVVIGGDSITGTTSDTVYVPNLNIGTLSIVTTGTTIIDNLGIESSGLVVKSYTTKRLEIGDWDMTATTQVTVAHGLSATEWKTMLESNVLIRNDSDTVYSPLKSLFVPSSGLINGGVSVIDSTNITLGRYTTGGFDDGAFTSTSYNRGWVTFDYIKD